MFSSSNAVLLQAAVSGYDERKTSKHRRKNRNNYKKTAHLSAEHCTVVGVSDKENLTGAMEGSENSRGRRNTFLHAMQNVLKVLGASN
ncbi:Hypp5529 [Branchiostoma lanceolatum]|uniref:Hypp5529 protein n=1 Tax=Branchiostoma lanceolatum TaxID=7740 RepID=A0A8J9VDG4_BRALA|nr:Hypp5529 [Branchiostoma lanceolatum]